MSQSQLYLTHEREKPSHLSHDDDLPLLHAKTWICNLGVLGKEEEKS